MSQCPDCHQLFSRRDAMLRHKKIQHREYDKIIPAQPSPSAPQSSMLTSPQAPPTLDMLASQRRHEKDVEAFFFKHPFTSIVSGPTSCGKTTFVKNLLQQNSDYIKPQIQRIIWLYKRWQPLYDDVLRTVTPKVEFFQGLPDNIESDDFIQPRLRNLVIIDDLATACSKDSRVSDLFTEGSHHRNLSVMVLNQNLYHSKNPTERRNCQYLVLFKNPMDKQAVMTLARQMYPGKTGYFLKQFDEATKEPYSYFLIDLRADTKEKERFQTNIFAIKGQTQTPPFHYEFSSQRGNMSNGENCTKLITIPESNTSHMLSEMNKMTPCDDCGVVFENVHDLQRHVKTWCPENQMGQPPTKRMKMDVTEDGLVDQISEPDAELPVYTSLMKQVQDENEKIWNKRVSRYMRDGLSENEATEKTNEKMEGSDMTLFLKKYGNMLLDILQLNKGPLHHKILNIIQENIQKKYSEEKAVKLALKQVQSDIQDMLPEDESDSDSETENEDNEKEDFE